MKNVFEQLNQQIQSDRLQNVVTGEGEMSALTLSLDWSKTPVGPVEKWPQSLRTSISILLASRFPMIIFWGPELVQFYNDPFRPFLGKTKHPAALGQTAQECWPEIWSIIGPMLHGVITLGEATWSNNQKLLLNRNGYVEECYFTFSYSPIRDESGGIGGVFCAVTETTGQVLSERRLRTLRELASDIAQAKTVEAVGGITASSLTKNPLDIPFALLYLIDEAGKQANLAGTIGLEADTPLSPQVIKIDETIESTQKWPLLQVFKTRQTELVSDLNERFCSLPFLTSANSPQSALVIPLARSGDEQLRGVLIVGLSPFSAITEEYSGFLQLVADCITTALANVRTYQEERKRVEILAELDRAKTNFFSDVSPEFRTPLTLMLGPLNDAIHKVGQDSPDQLRERLQTIHRNSLRLLKLVNNNLDISRIEAEVVWARMFRLFEEAPFFTCILRGPNLVFEFANSRYLKIIGNKDIIGKPLREALSEPAYEPFYQILDEVYRSGRSFIAKETYVPRVVRQIGSPPEDSYLDFIYQATKDENGNVDGILVHGVEVTDQVVARQRADFLAKSGKLLATSLDYETTLSNVARLAVPDLADWCIVDILNQNQTILRVAVAHADQSKSDIAQELKRLTPEMTKSHPVTFVLSTGETIFQQDVLKYPKEEMFGHPSYWEIAEKMELRSRIIVPMSINGKLMGAISLIYSRSGRIYNDSDLQFANELAQRAAIAVQNARLYKAEQEANQRLTRLQSVTSALSNILSAEQVATIIIEQGLDILNAATGFIALLSADGESLQVVKQYGYPSNVIATGQSFYLTNAEPVTDAAQSKEPIWLESLTALITRYPNLVDSQKITGNRAIAALPFVVEGRVLGLMGIGFREDRNFSLEERNFMLALAQQSAQAFERARLYEETQKAVETQKELDNLKDLFISVVSHELRNPLASIRGFGQLMQRQLQKSVKTAPNGQERRSGQDKLLRPLENIIRQTNRMNELIKQLLDFSRLQNEQLELNLVEGVNLVGLVEQVIEQQQVVNEEKRELILQTSQKFIIGTWDADRVEQVITNLLSNAIKYSPPDSSIVVGVETRPLNFGPEEQKPDINAAGEALVWVRDEGQGISIENQAKLFDRFYRVRNSDNAKIEGLGLGLYISNEIVTQHGGRIWVESQPGKGSVFYFSLPLQAS